MTSCRDLLLPSLEGGVITIRASAGYSGTCTATLASVGDINGDRTERVEVHGEPGASAPLRPLAGGLRVDRHTEW